MPIRITAKQVGLPQAVARLRGLPKVLRNRALRQALSKAGSVGSKVMKRETPRGKTRQTVKSIGYRVKLYRTSGRIVVIIGPRSGFKIQIGIKRPRFHNPTRIYNILDYRLHILPRVRSQAMAGMRETVRSHVQKVLDNYDASRIGQ